MRKMTAKVTYSEKLMMVMQEWCVRMSMEVMGSMVRQNDDDGRRWCVSGDGGMSMMEQVLSGGVDGVEWCDGGYGVGGSKIEEEGEVA